MLGWYISVFKLDSPECENVEFNSLEKKIAVWQSGINGVDWLYELVSIGKASVLSTNGGYPLRFAAFAEDIIPIILNGPPDANNPWKYEKDDFIPPDWEGRTTIGNTDALSDLDNVILLVEAWDES